MKLKLIQQAAEAKILQYGERVVKDRIKKSYRLPIIDQKLRKQRTKREFKLLEKASKLIPIPELIKTDEKEKIEMQFLKGKKLSESLDKLANNLEICNLIGKQIALLHDKDIIHGDLTTSNMILSDKDKRLYFIDFGLGYISSKIEDKAVDLHLIKQALEAKHFRHYQNFFRAVLRGYKASKNYQATLNRFEEVEKRGRYKKQY